MLKFVNKNIFRCCY